MALLALTAGQALANHVQCGDVITQDTTLDSDLRCPNNGIVIGADDITLDLRGHTITGPGLDVRSAYFDEPAGASTGGKGDFARLTTTTSTASGAFGHHGRQRDDPRLPLLLRPRSTRQARAIRNLIAEGQLLRRRPRRDRPRPGSAGRPAVGNGGRVVDSRFLRGGIFARGMRL